MLIWEKNGLEVVKNMSKAKLDKGDQQLEMVANYAVALFKGVASGIKRIIKEKDKLIIFIVVTLISGVIFYLRHEIAEHLVPNTGFHIVKIVLLLAPILPVLLLYGLGSEKQENENMDEFEKKFARIKFCGKDGKYPVFKGEEKKGKDVIYTFYSPGINIFEWKNRQVELETALDCDIDEIENSEKSKQIIILHTVPAGQGLSSLIQWDDSFIREEDFVICMGQGLLNDATINLNKNAHALIAGVSGSGKSVILRAMLWQCIKKGAKIYMVDFKGGVEFGLDYEKFGEVVTEREQALDLFKELTKEMKLRLKLFHASNVKQLCDYNAIHPENLLSRIVLVCDEISEMLDKTGLSKQDQIVFNEIEKEMSTLSRQGRAAGISMLLATQRPDAKVIPGQIKGNLDIRISGRMVDEQVSKMVLGNTKASQIPNIKGRFMYTIGADTYVFQAFKFDDDSLIYGDYQIGSMLIEQGSDCSSSNKDFSDYDEEKESNDYELDINNEELEELGSF